MSDKLKKYTFPVHVARLKKMLIDGNYEGCPASSNFNPRVPVDSGWRIPKANNWYRHASRFIRGSQCCIVCLTFMARYIASRREDEWPIVTIDVKKSPCPCHQFGNRTAIDLAHRAIVAWERENPQRVLAAKDVEMLSEGFSNKAPLVN